MSFRNLVIGTILMCALGCTGRQAPGSGAEFGSDNPAVDALFATRDRPGFPGCALAVSRDGEPVYSRGYGFANLDYDIPVTPQTVFDVASVTKQFVAASITMLGLEGRLSLDDNVRRWLPELPEYEQPITLEHMIYHTSGLRDYLTLFPFAGRDHYSPISLEQILDMMSRQRALNFTPGERYEYSNTAYMLLAKVIERASGKSLGEFAEERIFGPLGMDGSLMYDNYEEIIPRRATGYDVHNDNDVRMVHNFTFDVPGDGQMYTTVQDLLRWDRYLHVEKPAIYSAMLTTGALNNGDPTNRARGLYLEEYRRLATIQHTGSSWGSRSVLIRFVDPGLAIAIACNDGFSSPIRLAHGVADHYLADELGPDREEDDGADDRTDDDAPTARPTLTRDQLAEFSGVFYSAELDARYRFSVADDGLVVRIGLESPLAVVPVADDEFTISFEEQAYSGMLSGDLAFERDDSGRIAGFDFSSGTESGIVFEKQ